MMYTQTSMNKYRQFKLEQTLESHEREVSLRVDIGTDIYLIVCEKGDDKNSA